MTSLTNFATRWASSSGRTSCSPAPSTLKNPPPSSPRSRRRPATRYAACGAIPKDKGDNLMLTVTGLPEGLEEYVDFSMISQAEGLKFAIEHFRRRKPHCSGTLFWQLNDCWPVLSWSVIDYNGFGTAGYYYARRAYSPILASFTP